MSFLLSFNLEFSPTKKFIKLSITNYPIVTWQTYYTEVDKIDKKKKILFNSFLETAEILPLILFTITGLPTKDETLGTTSGTSSYARRYRIQGGGDRFSVHFAVTFLDRWRTSFCVTTTIKIVNNNTQNKQTSGISGVRCN